MVWSDSRTDSESDIFGTRVTASGVVQDPSGIAVSTAAGVQKTPSVASNGTDYLVVWTFKLDAMHRFDVEATVAGRVIAKGILTIVVGQFADTLQFHP